MQFRLRTLLIVLALGPMVLAGAWNHYAAIPPGFEWRIDPADGRWFVVESQPDPFRGSGPLEMRPVPRKLTLK